MADLLIIRNFLMREDFRTGPVSLPAGSARPVAKPPVQSTQSLQWYVMSAAWIAAWSWVSWECHRAMGYSTALNVAMTLVVINFSSVYWVFFLLFRVGKCSQTGTSIIKSAPAAGSGKA